MTVHRLRIDLAGSLRNAIDALNGEKGWTHPFREPPGEDERDASVATLEQIIEHIGQLRSGKATLEDFADFYCLTPRAEP